MSEARPTGGGAGAHPTKSAAAAVITSVACSREGMIQCRTAERLARCCSCAAESADWLKRSGSANGSCTRLERSDAAPSAASSLAPRSTRSTSDPPSRLPQSLDAAYTPVGTGTACRYVNIGRIA